MILATALLLTGGPQAQLKMKDVEVGAGRQAKTGDIVTVEYTGKLTDGKQFDSSKGKQPFSFVLGQGMVIKGWDQGVVGMKVGGKRHLTIPADLGYGADGNGDIPPNATLEFDIDLLRVDDPNEPAKDEITTVTPGKGTGAERGDEVAMCWRGTFINGKEFLNTTEPRKVATITIGTSRLPKGISDAFMGIKPGEKRHVVVPPMLGYKGQPSGGLPPFATLIFDIEAVSVTTHAAALERDKKMLKIEEEKVGDGAEAHEGDTVEINYTGMFPDGKKFDSSLDRKETFKFAVGTGAVIRGFDLGVLGMKVGGKRKVTIPPDLGYGARGAGNVIPPNATLVFEIELVSVKK